MRGKDRLGEESSFYSNGLDGIDESIISNRQRMNDTHTPTMLDDTKIGRHLDPRAESNRYHRGGVEHKAVQPPAEHILSEAMKN